MFKPKQPPQYQTSFVLLLLEGCKSQCQWYRHARGNRCYQARSARIDTFQVEAIHLALRAGNGDVSPHLAAGHRFSGVQRPSLSAPWWEGNGLLYSSTILPVVTILR